MADTKHSNRPAAGAATAGAERSAARKAVEQAVMLEEMRAAAEAHERLMAESADDLSRRNSEMLRAIEATFEPSAAEQAIVEAWASADLDGRLDALIARLSDTEARLDRQLARLDAEGG